MNTPKTLGDLEREKSQVVLEVAVRMEREFLLNALGRNEWSIDLAAREANMSPESFRTMMEKHNINGR